MIVRLLTEQHLEFLSLKVGCTGSSESTLVKMSNCWKSRALAHMRLISMCTFPVSGNRGSWSGSWLSTSYEFGSIQIYFRSMFRRYRVKKATKMCPKYLFDLSSDLIVSEPNTDK